MDALGRSGRFFFLNPPSTEDLYAQYPALRASSHKITSPCNDKYNCAGWVQSAMTSWVEPGFFWPSNAPVPMGPNDLDCYVAVFRSWGFEICESPDLEDGFLKIAIFATGQEFEHVAKQLPSGAWSSKGGPLHDFKHDELEALSGCGVMRNACAVRFMRRQYDGRDPMELEENGLLRI
jgi:hypothetical protein